MVSFFFKEVVKPKRPAGAVSMFGGLDPTALLKKKKGLSKDEPQSSSGKMLVYADLVQATTPVPLPGYVRS